MDVEVNAYGVLLAALSSMVVGSIWYAKPVFGKTWMKLAKIDEKKAAKGASKAITVTFLLSIVTAYVLAHVAYLSNQYFDNTFMQDTLTTAFWMWLGFVAARIATHDIFEMRRKKLTAMTLGNEFVTIMVMGLMIGFVGV